VKSHLTMRRRRRRRRRRRKIGCGCFVGDVAAVEDVGFVVAGGENCVHASPSHLAENCTTPRGVWDCGFACETSESWCERKAVRGKAKAAV
jgi:hypothetical protein